MAFDFVSRAVLPLVRLKASVLVTDYKDHEPAKKENRTDIVDSVILMTTSVFFVERRRHFADQLSVNIVSGSLATGDGRGLFENRRTQKQEKPVD